MIPFPPLSFFSPPAVFPVLFYGTSTLLAVLVKTLHLIFLLYPICTRKTYQTCVLNTSTTSHHVSCYHCGLSRYPLLPGLLQHFLTDLPAATLFLYFQYSSLNHSHYTCVRSCHSSFRSPAVALHSTLEEIPIRPYLIWSSINLLTLPTESPLFTLLQPHQLSCCSLNWTVLFLSQGLCIGCSVCSSSAYLCG